MDQPRPEVERPTLELIVHNANTRTMWDLYERSPDKAAFLRFTSRVPFFLLDHSRRDLCTLLFRVLKQGHPPAVLARAAEAAFRDIGAPVYEIGKELEQGPALHAFWTEDKDLAWWDAFQRAIDAEAA